mmetsp:Transcript_8608/g.14591  ORF Transcript_8608/g.14591 Transcript_8608/m.14591 type:complete len:677 (+) Transcript_8608:68-2098(+)|eukprot:CAMPEP_0114422136 /NCGR_PEP_ID=MMETSP0103-20121206/5451_1 /TAXON_ID=37642 ORGANISM="Paraphysomonas imperforata, Strain PA2" /NCGR_SAMPLE_ID=MMETSP0103 /ASSEMBLY_ACC=CAM_ASM_000201 /LENGTH=676 /DNA_ID=CAMNT_0001590705 /DNA_START=86 /DNA_END=2116 /DNA_ORIENTATION=+
MEGYLAKKGRGKSVSFIRPWATRYFVLDEQECELRYYEKDSRNLTCKGSITLNGVEIFECLADGDKKHCFELHTKHDSGVLVLSAQDQATKDAWVKALSKFAVGEVRESMLLPETTSQQTHLDFFSALENTPAPAKKMKYGTAGFRDEWQVLPSTFIRMGALAALRSRHLGGKCVGVMITASHNPEKDNGIKIVDIDGGMLSQDWEPYAEQFANCQSAFEFVARYYHLAESLGAQDETRPANVIIGRDTRPHSFELFERVCLGVRGLCGSFFDIGEVTTPQLHFVVQKANLAGRSMDDFSSMTALHEYHRTLMAGYTALRESFSAFPAPTAVTVDAAFGVGGVSLINFVETLSAKKGADYLKVDIRNRSKAGPVNEQCGAELVQKGRRPPNGVAASSDEGKLLCSYDGDADRIVFHSFLSGSPSPQWVLFDGDKIAALVSAFLIEEVQHAGLDKDFRMGVVQTAYANGGATSFLRARNIEIVFTKTGVKYLHHAALDFDIGVYFEANGHGTVVFSTGFMDRVMSYKNESNARKNLAFMRLKACLDLINQAVGDALSDMLFTLVALQALNFDTLGWHNTYVDLPSRQTKVPVTNKDLITCSADEMRVVSPQPLQDELEEAMRAIPCGRCFVRPSGTEDYVRVYAEAETQEGADSLAFACIRAINNHVGVLGELPTSF